jgi:beta-ribofuranosylaminobenzene 5'-phosphate synthase
LLEAINKSHSLGLNLNDLVKLSGRGGASGVGVYLFDQGGIVWDGGHASAQLGSLMPSSDQMPQAMPPLLGRWNFPGSWRVCLCLPPDPPISGDDERAFFGASTPIPANEAYETIATVCHDLIPAFALEDLVGLRLGLKRMRQVGFKKREVENRSEVTRGLLARLDTLDSCACGMSSLGPLVYAIVEADDERTQTEIAVVAREVGAEFYGPFNGWNSGRTIRELASGEA